MTTRRIVTGTMIAGFALAGLAAPIASAAPTAAPPRVDSQVSSITQQAQAYMDSHPAGNKMLMTAALQPRQEAAQTISDYASSNPQEYADFKSILAPLGCCRSSVACRSSPAQFQWAFDQFVG